MTILQGSFTRLPFSISPISLAHLLVSLLPMVFRILCIKWHIYPVMALEANITLNYLGELILPMQEFCFRKRNR